MGAALGLDGHHMRIVQQDQRFPHGGAADAQLLGQLPVVQRVAGLELHGDDAAAHRVIRQIPRVACGHCAFPLPERRE